MHLFGELGDPNIGSVFYDLDQPRFGNVTLSDDLYRLFIRAKIVKNSTRVTPDDIMGFANFIFETTGSVIQNEGDAAYTLLIGRELTAFERSLLSYVDQTNNYRGYLVPKPVGVRVNYGDYDIDSFFGFSDTPNAKGFGELLVTGGYGLAYGQSYGQSAYELAEGVGGKFANIY